MTATPTTATAAAPSALRMTFSAADFVAANFGRPGTLFDTSQKLREQARVRESTRSEDQSIHLRAVAAQRAQEKVVGQEPVASQTPEAYQARANALNNKLATGIPVSFRA